MLCFLPAREFPEVGVPLVDKWVHFILFGAFSFLWACAYPSRRPLLLLATFGAGLALGWLVEGIQGLLTALGRSYDPMDVLADGIGSALGVLLFALLARLAGTRGSAPPTR